MSWRLLITISRTWDDWDKVTGPLRSVLFAHPDAVLVSGAASRGDADVERIWARMLGMTRTEAVARWRIEQHPADWDKYGKAAGFRRNTEMARSLPDACIAWIRDGSRGASHCAAEADMQGVPVRRITASTPGMAEELLAIVQADDAAELGPWQQARWDGHCRGCGRHYEAGEDIARDRAERAFIASCCGVESGHRRPGARADRE